jgi:CheY-like chemotaxis protein
MAKARTILIADDSQRYTGLIKDAFARTGVEHTLHFIDNGEDAAAYLLGAPPFHDRAVHPSPDLLMLEVALPLRTGFEVLEWLKSIVILRHIPVCLMSSFVVAGHRERAAELGATWFHLKRAAPESWDRIVREMFAQSPKKPAPSDQK